MIRQLISSDVGRSALGLLVLTVPLLLWVTDTLPSGVAQLVETARDDGPSEVELDQETRNYYDDVQGGLGVDAKARHGLATRFTKWYADAAIELPESYLSTAESGALRQLDGFMLDEIKPNFETIHRGVPLRTNRWGQRDQDYEKKKPPATYRIALVGGSNVFGNGVEQDKIFENLLEIRLNEELGGTGYDRYEILNFSRSGLSLLGILYLAEYRTTDFEPDLIVVTITRNNVRWSVKERLAKRISQGRDLHYDFLKQVVKRAGIDDDDSSSRIERKLQPFLEWMVDQCLQELSTFSRQSGIPVGVLALRREVDRLPTSLVWQADKAEEHGLIVLRAYQSYKGRNDEEMYLFPGRDHHPSYLAHRLLADEIFNLLMNEPRVGPVMRGEDPSGNGPSQPPP